MGLITVPQVADGDTAEASDINSPVNTIADEFNGNIESVNLADGAVSTAKIADSAVTTAKVANGAVTPDKLATGAASANVATNGQTTSSTTYADLATVGPSVTVTIGANKLALVILTCAAYNFTQGDTAYMSVALSGANTVAASDTNAYSNIATSANRPILVCSRVVLLTGLSTGSTTFTAKYRVDASTGTWDNRSITVIPL